MSTNRTVHIFGGGTFSFVANHLALAAPSFGETARKLQALYEAHPDFRMVTRLHLTRMAGGDMMTNEDVAARVAEVVADPVSQVLVLNAALVDFDVKATALCHPGEQVLRTFQPIGKYATRLDSSRPHEINLKPAAKVRDGIRKTRKDLQLILFKTTCGAEPAAMYAAGIKLLKTAGANLVFVNDTKTRMNMIVVPEESAYEVTSDRDAALRRLVEISMARTHLKFTRSTVVDAEPVPWTSDLIPENIREVVDFCVASSAYKPVNGATAGHFAVKVDDTTFLTSRRKRNFNELDKLGLILVKTDGPDSVIAFGDKPSVGGQSQRIVFREHPGYDCIVHFHCPLRADAVDSVPTQSQWQFECGSHECGKNTSEGLKTFDNGIKAVYLEQHGPNIVFTRDTPAAAVIDFIRRNFDLGGKTDGYTVSPTV